MNKQTYIAPTVEVVRVRLFGSVLGGEGIDAGSGGYVVDQTNEDAKGFNFFDGEVSNDNRDALSPWDD